VVVGSPLLLVVVAAAGTLVVLVAAAFPSPLVLSARARAGHTRKARMQIEIATSRRWKRLGRVEVQHGGVATDPNRSPFEPSRKSSPFASPPRRRVLISSLDRTPRPWDIQ
jgi:hypothetical protein